MHTSFYELLGRGVNTKWPTLAQHRRVRCFRTQALRTHRLFTLHDSLPTCKTFEPHSHHRVQCRDNYWLLQPQHLGLFAVLFMILHLLVFYHVQQCTLSSSSWRVFLKFPNRASSSCPSARRLLSCFAPFPPPPPPPPEAKALSCGLFDDNDNGKGENPKLPLRLSCHATKPLATAVVPEGVQLKGLACGAGTPQQCCCSCCCSADLLHHKAD